MGSLSSLLPFLARLLLWLLLGSEVKHPQTSELNCNNGDRFYSPSLGSFSQSFPTCLSLALQSFLSTKYTGHCFIVSSQKFLYIFHQTEDNTQPLRKIHLILPSLMAVSGRESFRHFLFTNLSYQFNNFFPWQIIVCVCVWFQWFLHITFKVTVSLLGDRKIAGFIILRN